MEDSPSSASAPATTPQDHPVSAVGPEAADGPTSSALRIWREDTPPLASAMLAAYRRREREMLAIPQEKLLTINADVIGATVVVQAAVKRLRRLQKVIEGLPGIDMARIDAISDFALAVRQAHSDFAVASKPPEMLPSLLDRATTLRDVLAAEARVLGVRGLADVQVSRSFQSGFGFRGVAEDLLNVSTFLSEHWRAIEGRTSVRAEELDDAAEIASSIFAGLSDRQQENARAAKAALMRQRAWTLMINAYDHARRAVEFVRWDRGDADKYTPSIHAVLARGRRRSSRATSAPGVAPGVAPGTSPGTTPGNGQSGASAPVPGSASGPVQGVGEAPVDPVGTPPAGRLPTPSPVGGRGRFADARTCGGHVRGAASGRSLVACARAPGAPRPHRTEESDAHGSHVQRRTARP